MRSPMRFGRAASRGSTCRPRRAACGRRCRPQKPATAPRALPRLPERPMDVVQQCIEKVRGRGLRVVFPEGGDDRVVAAAKRLREEGIAEAIVLGDIETSAKLDEYAALYVSG